MELPPALAEAATLTIYRQARMLLIDMSCQLFELPNIYETGRAVTLHCKRYWLVSCHIDS